MKYKVKVYFKMPDAPTISSAAELFLECEKLVPNGVQTLQELVFDSEDALYHYVRGFDYAKRNGTIGNHVLEAIMTVQSDSQRHKKLFKECWYNGQHLKSYVNEYYCLGYLIKDETGLTIDLRNYEKELYKFDYAGYVRLLREKRDFKLKKWRVRNDILCEKHLKLLEGKSYWNYYRRMRTTQERRYTSDSEHKPFIRGKRRHRHLPDAWCAEKPVRREKTWKARTKVKRKWQVNLSLHVDTVRYDKKVYDKELLLEYDAGLDDILFYENNFQ